MLLLLLLLLSVLQGQHIHSISTITPTHHPYASPPSLYRFLVRLLLVHGTLSHYRLARLIKYSFYKNIVFNFVLFWFQFYCGYSGMIWVCFCGCVFGCVFGTLRVLCGCVLGVCFFGGGCFGCVPSLSSSSSSPHRYHHYRRHPSNGIQRGVYLPPCVVLLTHRQTCAILYNTHALPTGVMC